jgi:hypothetical protein
MKKGDLFPISSPYSVINPLYSFRVRYTGEKRCPKKGEWYISGAIPEGYLAPSDLSYPMHIGVPVRVSVKTVETVVEEIKGDVFHYASKLRREKGVTS